MNKEGSLEHIFIRHLTYSFSSSSSNYLPRERIEAKALEGVAQQVEQNLELATRRAAMAEAAAEQLRAQVARLTREKEVREERLSGEN